MKLPIKTVPAPDGGTIPLRTSKNPVLGVYLHHCGSVASVHRPKGKRKNTLYLICDECKTDQCAGAAYQEKIAANMQPNIEALQKTCDMPGELPVKIFEEKTADEPSVIDEIKAIGLECGLEVDGKTGEPLKPIDTAEIAVYSPTQAEPLTEKLAETSEPVKPLDTAKTAAQTETADPVEQAKPENAKRIGLFAIIGAGLGALLAI
ncbi:hypothetical protein [Pseudoalteromonas sp. JB197]|uniref:hypothetical protein n=1 Tax=Pseudoalteromonas sp. JB197 TaxID=1434839 RepID=UPI00097F63E3|nr:hypothetical protein [Pseudoalteromonas sp. JB197]PCC12906.1 hypothetical protein CIK86_06230 [Pseudoalteromonas sp. JB197]SJN25430.1 hypothetical protein CZ797_04235 [Pseudoalteromonas sp. JB197]